MPKTVCPQCLSHGRMCHFDHPPTLTPANDEVRQQAKNDELSPISRHQNPDTHRKPSVIYYQCVRLKPPALAGQLSAPL